jgi:hypothetical protein
VGPKTTAARKLVRQDTVAVLLSTDNWDKANNKYLSVLFLKSLPRKFGDVLKIQREVFLPGNEELVKGGRAISWATTAVRYPNKFDPPYDAISFDGTSSLAETEKAPPKEWLEKWHGDQNREWMTRLNASRTRYEGELWRLVDQTTPK